MTKILVDKAVIEQALKALEIFAKCYSDGNEAIAALRTSLEQPQDHFPDAGNRVPTGWKLVPVEPTNEMVQAWLDTYEGNIQTVYRAMLAAARQPPVVEQPQVEQEPVAVAKIIGMDEFGPMLLWHRAWTDFPVGTKLYTRPQPKREPLTDEQITELADAHMEAFAQFVGAGEVWFEGEKEFARAIERAHGITGEQK